MNDLKILMGLSFGRDSYITYLKNLEQNKITKVYHYNNSDKLFVMPDWVYEKLKTRIEFDVLSIVSKTYFEMMQQYFNTIDIPDYYLSIGEYESLFSILLYVKEHFKGFYNPYLFKPKNRFLTDMIKYETEFIVTAAMINDEQYELEISTYIGRILSAQELIDLYYNKREIYQSFQTFIISDNFLLKNLFSEEDKERIVKLFDNDKTRYLYKGL